MFLSHAKRRVQVAERGMTLLIVLVVLVIMALTTAAVMRSTSSNTAIVGNLAFQQAAVSSGDRGIEAAMAWLQDNTSPTTDQAGYVSWSTDFTGQQSAAELWAALSQQPVSVGTDAAGNAVAYVIERLCPAASKGVAAEKGTCAAAPQQGTCSGSKSATSLASSLNCSTQFYYRITVRTEGPRHTVSFSQALVAQ